MNTTRLDVRRRDRLSLALATSLTALLIGGCAKPAAAPPPAPPKVTVTQPEMRDVTLFEEFTGATQAVESIEVRARVQGYLEKVAFEPSSFVTKGQVLFVIEQAPYIATRDRVEANIQAAEAGLRRTESDLDRLEQAVKTNAVSEQEVTRARAERDQAAAALLEAQAALTTAEINLGYTTIRSPIDGLISRHLVDSGNLVGAGEATLLATVRRINPIFAYFQVNERFIAQALADRGGHKGSGAEGSELAATLMLKETGLEIEGRVDAIDNTVDPATGTIQVRAVFDNPNALIFPGFFVHIRLPGKTLENALLVDEVALGTDLGGRYLMIVGADTIVEKRYITPGTLEPGGKRVILDGLEASERYILDGLQRARPGMPVNPSGGTS